MPTLELFRHGDIHRQVEIGPTGIRIGRALENDLVLEDGEKGVSRFHAEIRPENGHFVVVDLGSQNGVWLEGRRITKDILEDGATLRIGPYRLVFDENGERDDAAAQGAMPNHVHSGARAAGLATPTPVVHSLRPTPPPGSPSFVDRLRRMLAPGPRLGRLPIATVPVPVLMGGGTVAGIVAIVVIVNVTSSKPVAPQAPQASQGADIALAAPEPNTGTADEIARLLQSARALIEGGHLQEARTDIDGVLALDAENVAAKDLVAQIESLKATKVNRPPQARAWPAGLPMVTARPDEPPTVRENRARILYDDYQRARASLDAGNSQLAVQGFQKILEAEPGYHDVTAQIAEANRRLTTQRREQASRHLSDAQRFEQAGDLIKAVKEYEAAISAEPQLAEAREGLDATQKRMRVEGDKAFKDATLPFAMNRFAEARELYEKAANYLPSSDPRMSVIQDRLSQIRGK